MTLLSEGCVRLGIDSTAVVDRLEAYLSELALWNRRQDLVKASDDRLVVNHLLDSLSGLEVISALPNATVADVGSGAGFPGVPLAICLERSAFTLIERSSRRAAFLRDVVTLLDLRDRVSVLEKDLCDVREEFALVTFRAFRNLPDFASRLFAVTADGGSIVAFKGRRAVAERELAEIEPLLASSQIYPVEVPFLEEERNIVVIHPHRPTEGGDRRGGGLRPPGCSIP